MIDLEAVVDKNYHPHPFATIKENADHLTILRNYLAMSQAFPYLQAGSQQALIMNYMQKNEDIPEDVELTSVVGNFLCWDETGGFYLTLASGVKGLPRILETRRFHANLLKKDLQAIFGQAVTPLYSDATRHYLSKLSDGLSAICPVKRVAYMVSFETHANRMISALWESLAAKYPVDKNKLSYFYTHVGGEDPAEVYHVQMTNNLIEKCVPENRLPEFEDYFTEAYQLNYQWCQSIQ